jgi:hypothetical protein
VSSRAVEQTQPGVPSEQAPPRSLREEKSPFGLLLGLGLALLAACLFYAFVIPLTPVRLERSSAALIDDFGLWSWIASPVLPVPEDGHVLVALLSGFTLIAFGVYGAAVYLCWRRPAAGRSLVAACAVAALCWLAAALALPTVNTDIFDYIAFGRVAAEHGANPYEVPPSAFPDDPAYPYASGNYKDSPDNKLPAWQLVNRVLAELGGDDPTGTLLVYRFAFFLFNVGNLALVGLIVRAVEPRAVLAAVVFFGWNPIVAVFGQSKTDTVMVFFFLLATFLLVRGWKRPADASFAISALVKLITLPLAAVYWLRSLALRKWRDAAATAVIFAALTAIVYLPFGGLDLFVEQARSFSGGHRTGAGAPGPASPALSDVPRELLVAGVAVAMLLAVALLRRRRDESVGGLLRVWGFVALVFAILLADPRSPWYLLTLVAAAALARHWLVSGATVALCFGAFLFNAWRGTSSAEHPLPDVASIPEPVLFLLPLAILAVVAGAVWLRRRAA